MDIFTIDCPQCGNMIEEDELEVGYCPHCGLEFEFEEAA